jgi:hypothetical protein
MKPATWFRIAFVVMLLFAVGHTFGFLTFRPATAEGQAVWAAMNSVRFSVGHATFSYGGFYVGFGLFVTAFLAFQTWLVWFLGKMAERAVVEARGIAWSLCVLQVASVGLSLRYFAAVPAVLSVLAAACLGMGALRMGRGATALVAGARGETRVSA